jgi:hypothetical protein
MKEARHEGNVREPGDAAQRSSPAAITLHPLSTLKAYLEILESDGRHRKYMCFKKGFNQHLVAFTPCAMMS